MMSWLLLTSLHIVTQPPRVNKQPAWKLLHESAKVKAFHRMCEKKRIGAGLSK